jgi:hypothetical protein
LAKASAMSWCLTEKRKVHLLARGKNTHLTSSGDSKRWLKFQWSWVFQSTSYHYF